MAITGTPRLYSSEKQAPLFRKSKRIFHVSGRYKKTEYTSGELTLLAMLSSGCITYDDLLKVIRINERICDMLSEDEIPALSEMNLAKLKRAVGEVHHAKISKGKDGRWSTVCVSQKGERKRFRCKDELLFYSNLANYYGLDVGESKKATIESIYEPWRAERIKLVSPGTVQKDDCTWRTLKASPIIKKPIEDILPGDLVNALLSDRPTKRLYNAQKSLLSQILAYAVRQRIISTNPALELHGMVTDAAFTPEEQKDDHDETFWDDERSQVIAESEKMFESTRNTVYLGIVLDFQLGLRVGELSCLKVTDFDFKHQVLILQRSEKGTFSEDCTQRTGVTVSDSLKKGKRYRIIPVGSVVQNLVQRIRNENAAKGYVGEWLFISEKGDRKKAAAFDQALFRVNKHLGLKQKSIHSIRKTVISELGTSGVLSPEELKQFAGHSSISTTDRYYIRSIGQTGRRADAVESVLTQKA